MHVNVHSAIGIIFAMLFSSYLTNFQIIFVIGISFIIDFDFIFSKFAENHNHRRLITHTFFLYILLIAIGLILLFFNLIEFWIYVFLIGTCGFIHVLVDTFDWGTMVLYPFKRDIFGGYLSIPPKLREDENALHRCFFIITYYNSNLIKILEIGFGISALMSILIKPELFYVIFLFIGLTILHLIQYYNCKKRFPDL